MRTREELIWKKNPKTIQFECPPCKKETTEYGLPPIGKNKHLEVQTKRDGQKDGAFEKEKDVSFYSRKSILEKTEQQKPWKHSHSQKTPLKQAGGSALQTNLQRL